MLAFIFPGQGSQAVGMGKSLASTYAIAREIFAQAEFVWDALKVLPAYLKENLRPAVNGEVAPTAVVRSSSSARAHR